MLLPDEHGAHLEALGKRHEAQPVEARVPSRRPTATPMPDRTRMAPLYRRLYVQATSMSAARSPNQPARALLRRLRFRHDQGHPARSLGRTDSLLASGELLAHEVMPHSSLHPMHELVGAHVDRFADRSMSSSPASIRRLMPLMLPLCRLNVAEGISFGRPSWSHGQAQMPRNLCAADGHHLSNRVFTVGDLLHGLVGQRQRALLAA